MSKKVPKPRKPPATLSLDSSARAREGERREKILHSQELSRGIHRRATILRRDGKLQKGSTTHVGRDAEGRAIPHARRADYAAKVRELAKFLTDDEIAITLNIRPGQLREHYLRELQLGAAEATVAVGKTAFRDAKIGGRRFAATAFWLERRAGWTRPEHVKVDLNTQAQISVYLPTNGREVKKGAPARG